MHLAGTAPEGHPFRKMYKIFLKSIQSMPSPELIFPPNLMGPFSLVQSQTLLLENVEKIGEKALIRVSKIACIFGKK